MTFSVAMCTYNGEKYLKQQIDSILGQTVKVQEIVICDDCSTDHTVSILNSYKENHPHLFKIFFNESNLGSIKNFEKAISICQNEIIFLSDQDDIWTPNKVNRIVSTFAKNKDISVIFTNGYGINDCGEIIDVFTVWDSVENVKMRGYKFDYFNILNLRDNFCTGATMAMRNTVKHEMIPIPILEGLHHDKWIAMIASVKDKLYFLDEKLIYYREHASQQVGNVLYKNTEGAKFSVTNYFSIDKEEKSFRDYKKILKSYANAYKYNLILLKDFPVHHIHFNAVLKELKRRFTNDKSELLTKFPIRGKLLILAEFFVKKRNI